MIFISYAREDARAARDLEARLVARGVAVHLDPPLPEGDAFWRNKIAAALSESTAVIALCSESSESSPWVEQERRAFAGPTLSVDLRSGHQVVEWESETFWRKLNALGAIGAPPSRVHEAQRFDARAAHDEAKGAAEACISTFGRSDVVLEADGDVWINAVDGASFVQIGDAPLWLARTPVTNAQYAAFLSVTGRAAPPTWAREEFRKSDQPVTGVSWFDAACYAAWAGGRLPSEREWERAARIGAPNAVYATSTGAISSGQADFGRPFAEGAPSEAGSRPATNAGFHGLCGNTWDWCETAWDGYRVLKGGGYMDAPAFCSIAARYRNAPTDRDCCVGFRVCIG